MIVDHWLSPEERMVYRRTDQFRKTNALWAKSGLNSPGCVGEIMKYMTLLRPQSLEDWQEKYFTQVLPKEALHVVSMKWAKASKLRLLEAKTQVFIRVIEQSWEGYERELKVKAKLESMGAACKHASWDEDNAFGIDLIATFPGQPPMDIQVKPGSFFRFWQYKKTRLVHGLKRAEAAGRQVLFINAEELLERGIFNPIPWRSLDNL